MGKSQIILRLTRPQAEALNSTLNRGLADLQALSSESYISPEYVHEEMLSLRVADKLRKELYKDTKNE